MSTALSSSWSALIGASNDSLQRDATGPLPAETSTAFHTAPSIPWQAPANRVSDSHTGVVTRAAAAVKNDSRSSASSSPEPAEVESLHLISRKGPPNMMAFAPARGFGVPEHIPGVGMDGQPYPSIPSFIKTDRNMMVPNMGMMMNQGSPYGHLPMGNSPNSGMHEPSERSSRNKSEDDEKPEKPEKPEKEKSKSKKKSKKRGRNETADSSDVSRVRLSREDLLRVSSKELEDFAARCAAEKPLSAEEVREIKRQRRLIKNREYAQASRVKKKDHLKEIEARFNDLEEENYNLKLQMQNMQSRMAITESENRELKLKLANAAQIAHGSIAQAPPVAMSNSNVQAALPSSNAGIGASGLGLGLPSLSSSLGELKFSGGAIGASGFIPDLFSSDGATAPMPAFRPMNSGV